MIEAEGRKAIAIPGNLSDENFCKTLVEEAVGQMGGLDILVNNASRQTAQKSIEDLTTEQFDNTFKVNVYALFWICKAAMPHLDAGSTIIRACHQLSQITEAAR